MALGGAVVGGVAIVALIAATTLTTKVYAMIDDKALFHFRKGKAEINFIAVKNCNQVEWKFLSTAM